MYALYCNYHGYNIPIIIVLLGKRKTVPSCYCQALRQDRPPERSPVKSGNLKSNLKKQITDFFLQWISQRICPLIGS